MSALATDINSIAAIGAEVAQALARSTATRTCAFITTPLLYPGGSTVSVRIEGGPQRFLVTDGASGYRESMNFDGVASYRRLAPTLAERFGIKFDSQTFFLAETTRDGLVSVVMSVANCSQRAVTEAILHHEARKGDEEREALVSRLSDLFGRDRVARDVEVRGHSTLSWEVTAQVSNERGIALFDHAKPHRASVTNIAAKFHDIARLETPPHRIVVVRDRRAMGQFIGLLSQAASVIESAAPNDVLVRLAA